MSTSPPAGVSTMNTTSRIDELDEPVPESVADVIRSHDGMLDVWLVDLDIPE